MRRHQYRRISRQANGRKRRNVDDDTARGGERRCTREMMKALRRGALPRILHLLPFNGEGNRPFYALFDTCAWRRLALTPPRAGEEGYERRGSACHFNTLEGE